ncbi:hypothetical protein DVK02_07180 [Halobellus sp. Atlit-31R]|nr:hypothetical protein DVK02_07180 [Halobellus sp. Atlit-31R]
MSSDLPEPEIFENGSVQEIAVDGRSVARVEFVDDISTSPVDDAAIAVVLRALSDAITEGFEEQYDVGVAEALERGEPLVEVADPAEWETLGLDQLAEYADEDV